MKYATAAAFRVALEHRLSTYSQQRAIPLVRLRKLVVFDRLLARLMIVAPNRWVLKGAVALNFRAGSQFRTTKDLDISRQDSEELATQDFLAVQALDLDDFFSFAIERTADLAVVMQGATVRYHVTAQLAGRRFDDVTVDVNFGDPVLAEPDLVSGPNLLSFANISPAKVPILPLEQHVAEKVHAYTRRYAAGNQSTRVKDLIDIVMISSSFVLKAERLQQALTATFDSRNTHKLSTVLPSPPTEWRIAYRRIAVEVGLDPHLETGYEQAKTFLDPLLAGIVTDTKHWSPTVHVWQ